MTTYDGLVRFDGVRFTVFDKTNTPGIATNRLGSLFEGRDGTLWIASRLGGVIRYQAGLFTTYTTEHGLAHPYVRGITGDEDHVWVLANDRIQIWDEGRFRNATLDAVAVPFRASEWDTQIFWALERSTLHRFTQGSSPSRTLPESLRDFPAERYAEDPSGPSGSPRLTGVSAGLVPPARSASMATPTSPTPVIEGNYADAGQPAASNDG